MLHVESNMLSALITTNLFSVVKQVLQIRRVWENKNGYKPGLSIWLLNRDSADTMIWGCSKFVEELSWQLYFCEVLILWDQEQDCEESSFVRNRITGE